MNISWKCLRNAAIFSLILWVLIFWGVPACRGGEPITEWIPVMIDGKECYMQRKVLNFSRYQELRERVEALEKKWEDYEGWKFAPLPSIIRTELNDLLSPRTPDTEDLTDGRSYSTTPDWPSIAPQTLEIKWTDDGQCYKQYSWGYVTVPCPKTLSIEWLGHLVVSVEGAADKVYSMQGLSNYEIGLRSDGVVVWREAEK